MGKFDKPIVSFKLDSNAAERQKRFQVVEGKVVDVVKAGIRAGVKGIAQDARKIAPVAAVHRSKYHWGTRPKQLKKEIRYKVGEKNMVVWGMVQAAFPGKFQELGTKLQKAQPFIHPPFNARKSQIIKDMAGKI